MEIEPGQEVAYLSCLDSMNPCYRCETNPSTCWRYMTTVEYRYGPSDGFYCQTLDGQKWPFGLDELFSTHQVMVPYERNKQV